MSPGCRPIAILIAALGGEGGGVLAEWLVEAATRAGYPAQSTSIPGVAQRTGATTYYVEIFPVLRVGADSSAQARPDESGPTTEPVLGLYPVPGGVDLVVASELLEAGRAVLAGMVSSDRTTLVTSVTRTLTTQEKIALGDGRFDPDKIVAVARAHSRRMIAFDMERVAREEGTMLSAVMYGAIAATNLLPMTRETFEAVIRDAGVGIEPSLRGFAAAYVAATGTGRPAIPAATMATPTLPTPIAAEFPASMHDILGAGYARLVAFQHRAYADLYVERLRTILAAERAADGAATHGYATTRETARFLALWMAFDDIVRVASLKCRASRFARVHREVGAREGDVVRIVDYFKPGIPEMAGLLPPALARRLIAWDRARQSRGKAPVAFALHLKSDGVLGFALLRLLAGLRGMRRRGARYAEEQGLIERWLVAIEQGTRADWRLGHELALCGRLVKGYGATNERAKRNLAHIIDHLAKRNGGAAGVDAIREARAAALADDAGTALGAALIRHGAPALPAIERPIVWARKRPAAQQRSAPS